MTTTRIRIADESGIAFALQEARKVADSIGFEKVQVSMIATIISELATNILKYAEQGQLSVEAVTDNNRKGVRISAVDNGPGIENIEESLSDHFSTSGTLGLGLPGVKRLADEFKILSQPGKGTRVEVSVWLW
jgi:serine/threonine-protein kinase RsbT